MHKALNIFPILLGLASRQMASGESSNRVVSIELDKYKKLHIMIKNFSTKTRWLVTIILLLSFGIGNALGTPTTIYSETFGSVSSSDNNKTWADYLALATRYYTDDNTPSVVGISGIWKVGNGNKNDGSNFWANANGAYCTFTFGNISSYSSCSVTITIRNGAGTSVDRTYSIYTSGNGGSSWSSYSLTTYKVQDYRTVTVTVPDGSRSNFAIKIALTGNHETRIDDVTLTGTAADCSATPSIGTASLNGSFNMTSTTSAIGVASGTCSTGNASCDWTDYGFVWSDGTATTTPTVSNNKVQIGTSGTATSWTGSVTPSGSTTPTSWTTGHTYYVCTYGKNSKTGAAFTYGTAWSFTPRSITFNSNGGSSVNTIYVNSGTAATKPSDPTKTGYTFGNWYQESTLENAVNWSSTISADKIYYAKWTANTYSVRFNKNNNDATGSMSNESFTYGESKALTSNAFSLVGYTFAGWATSAGGPVAYTDGQSVSNLSSTNDATVDLYAKWTAKSFTVTWMVNGESYSAGGSTSVNFDSHVATLPTAPTPPCGNKFMGWTTTNIGSVGIDKANTSAITALNLFTTAGDAPTISAEGNVTYYAVFADYAE